jgi:flagellar hook-associated protein 1 FlgK
MSSTFAGLNTMTRGLAAQQTSLDTVGHNIANASTAGYSRQSVNLATTRPETIYTGNGSAQKGTGVSITSIVRARDALVDKQMWEETSTLNYGQQTQVAFSKIESAFNEPTDTGMQSVLNQFWNSLQTLATNASDDPTRTQVRERGVELANTVQHSAQQLKDMVTDINATIDSKVSSINETSSEIASLNHQIRNIEAGGLDHANDLRDKRDLLVDQLSADVDVRVTELTDGTYTIQAGNVVLVNGDDSQKLTTSTPAGTATIDPNYGYEIKNVSVAGTYQPTNFTSGTLKGLIDSRDSTQFGVKAYLNNLSSISQFLQNDFNAVNRTGYGTDNSTNNNFFGDNTGTTLSQISSKDITNNFSPFGQTFVLGDTLTIGDAASGSGNTMNIDLSTVLPTLPITNAADLQTDMTALSTYINTNAPLQVPPVNIKANFDTTTGKFSLSSTGSSTQTSISGNTANATNFVNNLSLAAPTGSYWLNNMVVNPALFDPSTGLAKIDAKTAPNASTIVVTNTSATAGTAVANATGTYTGTAAAAVAVKLGAAGITYSTDGGTTWSANVASNGSVPPQYTFPINGANVTLQITGGAAGDNYSFSLSSSNTTSLAVKQSNSTGGAAVITSATGIYTKSTTATSVKTSLNCGAGGVINSLDYYTSTDGGKTWSAATNILGAGPYTMKINGLTVNLNVGANASNKTSDQYTFTLSQGNSASGDNAVLLSNRLKIDTTTTLGNKSLDTYYSSMIGALGVQSQDAQRLTTNQQALVDQITSWRESTSGINMDEEMTNMIKFQQGYSAAAKMLTTMDQMLDTLISSVAR